MADYDSNVHYIEDNGGFGEWMGVDLDGAEHYGATATICRERISDANRVIAKHREMTGENLANWPDAHTVATRTRNRANAQQDREWEAEKTAVIEKILGDTQTGPRRKPNPIYFLDCSDLCYAGK